MSCSDTKEINSNNNPSQSLLNSIANPSDVAPQLHHKQEELCITRPRYRQGHILTAVKVYTINDESCYLLLIGVPDLKLQKELKKLCKQNGCVEVLQPLPDYPHEKFTQTFVCKYSSLRDSRTAKKKLDGRTFFGGSLHVCYAPELENPEETRKKLLERRQTVVRQLTKQNNTSIIAAHHPDDNLTKSIERISSRLNYQPKDPGPNEVNVANLHSSNVHNFDYHSDINISDESQNIRHTNSDGLCGTASKTTTKALQSHSFGSHHYSSMSSDFEPGLGDTRPSMSYSNTKYNNKHHRNSRLSNDSVGNDLHNEMPKSMRVFKKIKLKERTTNGPFIGPRNKEDKTLKAWNETYNFTKEEHILEQQKSVSLKKKSQILGKFAISLKNSLSTPITKLNVKTIGRKETKSKIVFNKTNVKLL